jgi:transcriptional regulator with XRE-family HTH domain
MRPDEFDDVLTVWWSPDRFRMALILLKERRRRLRLHESEERIAIDMKLSPRSLYRYKVGDQRPGVKSLYWIAATLNRELGCDWPEKVDSELELTRARG